MPKLCHVLVIIGDKALLQRTSNSSDPWEPLTTPITRSGISPVLEHLGRRFLGGSNSLHYVRSLPATTHARILVAELLTPSAIATALTCISESPDLSLFDEPALAGLPLSPSPPALLHHTAVILREALGLTAPHPLTPPWCRPNWAARARAWILDNLPPEAGGEDNVIMYPVRTVEVGCVWRVTRVGAEHEGDIRQGWFFKASPARRVSEAVPETDYDIDTRFLFCEEVYLYKYLEETLCAEIEVALVPKVVAIDRDFGFILMVILGYHSYLYVPFLLYVPSL